MSDHLRTERQETDALKAEALRLGILIPRDPGWWYIDEDIARQVDSEMWELIKDAHEYLSDVGKSGTRRLIRNEIRKLKDEARQDVAWKRQNIQWKLTIAGVIIGWILGLSGIVIAVISLFKKPATH